MNEGNGGAHTPIFAQKAFANAERQSLAAFSGIAPHTSKFPEELNAKDFVQPGVLRAEKLVNMAKHNYRLEPNVSFTPDQKGVVFLSNMFGVTYVFAAEVAKAQ